MSTSDWVAAGVRHEILMRVMPTLRHDLLGPISVARMELAVLKRRIERADLEPADGLRRVQQLESHLVELTRGLRDLRRWDGLLDEQMPVGSIVALAVGLMEQPLRLAGLSMQVSGAEAGAGRACPVTPMLQGTLALLCHAQDHLPAGSRLQVTLEAEEARLTLLPLLPLPGVESSANLLGLVPVARTAVDAEAVRHLAASLGLHAVLDAEPWQLRMSD